MEKAWEIVDLRHQKNGKIKIVSGCIDIANVLTRDVDDPMHNARIIAGAQVLRARIATLEKAMRDIEKYYDWPNRVLKLARQALGKEELRSKEQP